MCEKTTIAQHTQYNIKNGRGDEPNGKIILSVQCVPLIIWDLSEHFGELTLLVLYIFVIILCIFIKYLKKITNI